MNCESCGKEGQDEKKDYCYGCDHIVCTNCCIDVEGNLIAGEHSLEDHKARMKDESFLNKPKKKR
jgi:hypothetical protein